MTTRTRTLAHMPSRTEARLDRRNRRNDLLMFVLCFALTLAVAYLFTASRAVSLGLAVLTVALPYRSLHHLRRARREFAVRQQYSRFIQELSVAISDGLSMTQGLIRTCQAFRRYYGPRDRCTVHLTQASHLLQARIPPAETVRHFEAAFPCPEARTLIIALRQSMVIGNRTLELLRAGGRMTTELNAVLREVRAAHGRQMAEASFLAVMPALMLLLLLRTAPAYMADARLHLSGRLVLGAAYLFSVLSAALALRYARPTLRSGKARPARHRDIRLAAAIRKSRRCQQMAVFYQRRLPRGYRQKLGHSLLVLRAELPEAERRLLASQHLSLREIHYLWKLPLALLALLTALGLAGLRPDRAYLGFAMIPVWFILHDYGRIRAADERLDRVREDFPLFINQLIVLLEAGFQPLRALDIMHREEAPASAMHEELGLIMSDLQLGLSLEQALHQLADRLTIPDVQQALNAVARYQEGGSRESLDILRLQARQCWHLARDAARKTADRDAARMMLPMFLDLLAVMMISVAPVLGSFRLF